MSRYRRPAILSLALYLSYSLVLLGCSQDASQVNPSLLEPLPEQQRLEQAQSDQQMLVDRLGLADIQPVVLQDNPISIELGPSQYSDSNLLVAMDAEVSSLHGELRQVQWLQESGPDAIILDPNQQLTKVWVPSVSERTTLRFRMVAVDGQGYLNSAITQIIVLPPEQIPPVTAAITLQNNEVALDIRLSQPPEQAVELSYFTAQGSALSGVDYEHTEGHVAFEPDAQSQTVYAPLLDVIRTEGRYFYLHLNGTVDGQWFERALLIPLAAQQAPFVAKPEAPPAVYEGASDRSQSELAGGQGAVRVHLEWQGPSDEDTLLQLRVTDPCGVELNLGRTEALCQEALSHYRVISETEQAHNVVWLEAAPSGNYQIALEHLSGPGAEYRLRIFWGEESALYTGFIGPEQRVRVGEVVFEGYDPWSGRILPRPSQPNANLASGAWHNLALDIDDNLWLWGDDSYGALTEPEELRSAVAVAAGGEHSLALDALGEVWAWGGNHYGQANVPADVSDVVAISAGAQHSLALRAVGTLIGWGDNSQGQGDVPNALRAVAIASGDFHNLALTSRGSVVAWGNQQFGQTAVPSDLPPITAIAAGATHSLALTANGRVFAWGANDQGQSNVPEGLEQVVAIAAGAHHSLALKSDGTVIAWGADDFAQATVPEDLREVVSISAGAKHSVALTADGLVVAWGNDELGQVSVPEGLAERQRFESRKHMLLLVLRGAEQSDIRVPEFGEDTNCSPITIPEFVAPEQGYAVAVATTVYLSGSSNTSFSTAGTLSGLDPMVSEQSGTSGLRLFTAGGGVNEGEAVSGTFSFSPSVSEHFCTAGSFLVAGANYVSHAWSPTNTDHGLTEVSLVLPEEVLPGDLLVLVTMHRQEYADGSTNRAVLTDSEFRKVASGNVSAQYVQTTTHVEEYQFITVWAKKASEVDAGRNLSIYSF